MARGFLGGVVLGGSIGVTIAGVVSILTPLPSPPNVGDAVPNVSAPDRPMAADSGDTASAGDDAVMVVPTNPQAPAPDPDTLTALDAETLTTASQPQTGTVEGLSVPADGTQTALAAPRGDDPVLPNPQALAPMAPEAADELSISTEPAQPPAPPTDTVLGAFDDPTQPSTEDSLETETVVAVPEAVTAEADAESEGVAQDAPVATDELVATNTDDGSVPETVAAAPEVVEPQETAQSEETQDASEAPVVAQAPAQPTAPLEKTEAAPEGSDTVVPSPETAPQTAQVDTGTAPQVPEADGAPAAPQSGAEVPQAPTQAPVRTASLATTAPSIGTPGVSLLDRDSGISIRRPGAAATAVTVAANVTASSDPNLRPVERFAQTFTRDPDKPLMSIVLIDDGTSPTNGVTGIAALSSFPYPLSFAVDTALPDAAGRVASLRAEGFEVLAMVALPEGAQATDVETTFGVVTSQFSEIVGVLEDPSASQQTSRDISDQAAAFLQQSGHGWVLQAKGLNTAATLARKEGVPAKPIFRDFDSKGQSAVVIRRFLDQAAFKAGQEGGVIMLGRLRPETIAALLLWGLQDRAGQVALAPISAVLLAED